MSSLYIISAPSGCGKTSLVEELIKRNDSLCVSVSHTTRNPRLEEINGISYYFISLNKFKKMINNDAFVEYAKVFDNYYGTAIESIKCQLKKGQSVILEIDWQGANQVKKKFPNAVSIFILPPSKEDLKKRLQQRAQDDQPTINKRMANAKNEMLHFKNYDYLVINEDFDIALSDLEIIICRPDKTFDRSRLSNSEQSIKYKKLLNKLI
ncbi:MAG TPA: guanylate kinase [Gammaproteobacteria bacterium]|jgi:guanylate kinase|nr:guanylate kinase [Gammaproteobacteria bacterium]|tara:strand:+ start:66 stop:692 length:627 start_codon:yes stop_codon:yes gene_type:complete